jgi:hypothetical protein
MILEACSGEDGEKLFLEMLTKEGIAQCLDHLVDNGILCVHTSHRFIDLPPILAAIAKDLNLSLRRGFDQAPGSNRFKDSLDEIGHYSSEWVLLARNRRTLDAMCKTPENYDELLRNKGLAMGAGSYWSNPEPSKQLGVTGRPLIHN